MPLNRVFTLPVLLVSLLLIIGTGSCFWLLQPSARAAEPAPASVPRTDPAPVPAAQAPSVESAAPTLPTFAGSLSVWTLQKIRLDTGNIQEVLFIWQQEKGEALGVQYISGKPIAWQAFKTKMLPDGQVEVTAPDGDIIPLRRAPDTKTYTAVNPEGTMAVVLRATEKKP